jgi:hypothetical protein
MEPRRLNISGRAAVARRVGFAFWVAVVLVRAIPSYGMTVVTAGCPKYPFDAESVPRLAAQIRAADDSDSRSSWAAGCASKALSRRGEEVIPTLIRLMEMRQPSALSWALEAVCGPGHSGSSAVPYILKRLRAPGRPFDDEAYGTLACIGKGAKPAIPFLMEKSLGETPGFVSQEGDLAINTLGVLAKYDPGTVIPHLTRLLDSPSHTFAVARALEAIGEPAKSAAPALRKRLSDAIASGERDYVTNALVAALGHLEPPPSSVPLLVSLLGEPGIGDSAASALQGIGKPAVAAVPSLIEHLQSPEVGSRERYSIISALTAIDGRSPAVQQALLREATSGADDLGTMSAALALAEIDPLPSEFAPRLVGAVESLDSGTTRGALQQALYRTHTGISADGSRQPPPPVTIDSDLVDGLWALTTQSQAMTLDAVIQHLRVERGDYDIDGEQDHGELMIRGSSAKPSRTANPIVMVMLFGVSRSYDGTFRQDLTVTLNRSSCLSASAITDHVVGSGNHLVNTLDGGGEFKIDGGSTSEKTAALGSLLTVGPSCRRQITLSKRFAQEYWSALCPFSCSQTLVDSQIIPGLKSDFGPGFSAYDLSAPQTEDLGRYVLLSYEQTATASPNQVRQTPRLRVEIKRCAQQKFSRAWEYWPQ